MKCLLPPLSIVSTVIFFLALAIRSEAAPLTTPEAKTIIQNAMDNWRGLSSVSEMTMTIKRKQWQRSMTMKAWTSGEDKSLIRVLAPKKDAGNATLTNNKEMWTYAPKINRVIKTPSSMMNQNWMGSDFSNKDISRSTDILNYYNHTISHTEKKEGHILYTITSVPHDDAPVVWGKEVLIIRDDYVIVSQEYWDQNNELVKVMQSTEITEMGGRIVAKTTRMFSVDTPDEWTEVTNNNITFDADIPEFVFTQSNLQNPRM